MKRLSVVVVVMFMATLMSGIVLGILAESNSEVSATVQSTGEVRAMQCVVVDEDCDIMVLKDEHNNLWLLDAGELSKDDVLCVWLDDMNTPKNLTDDEILNYCPIAVD